MSEDRTFEYRGGHETSAASDAAVAHLADRQHGVVSRRQLLDLGLSPRMVRRRQERGHLREVHRGVYAVGHTNVTDHGRWLAAVLSAGPGAVLSHGSAAALLGLRGECGDRIDVTTDAKRASTACVLVRGRRVLGADDRTLRAGIPVTTVARTLVDLAEVLPECDLARVVNEADVLGLLNRDAVDRALARTRGRRGGGTAALRTTIERHDGPALLRSELERRFHELLRDHALPPARHNVRVGRWEVDVVWRDARLVVELDGAQFHRTAPATARDREKERTLRAAGWHVLRYRWADVVGSPATVAAELRVLIGKDRTFEYRGGHETSAAQLSSASRR